MALQDLDQRFQIVDEQGKPSDYLMRLLRDRGVAADDVEQLVADLNVLVLQLEQDVLAKADKIIEINAGTGLAGGGDLSANRTITLNALLDNLLDVDTTTTPPTDQQALIYDGASSLWIPGDVAAGGGGGGWTEVGTYEHAVDGPLGFKIFTGIDAYTDILVVGSGITLSGSAFLLGQVSIDGGTTFYTGGTDHVLVSSANQTDGGGSATLMASSTSTSVTRSILWRMYGNKSGVVFGTNLFSDTITRRLTATTTTLNAIRIGANGVTMTGGKFTVYGK